MVGGAGIIHVQAEPGKPGGLVTVSDHNGPIVTLQMSSSGLHDLRLAVDHADDIQAH